MDTGRCLRSRRAVGIAALYEKRASESFKGCGTLEGDSGIRSRLVPLALTTVLAVALACAGAASADTATGERAEVTYDFTTTEPGAPSGFEYRAVIRDPSNPGGDPPALREIIIGGPRGARIDTSAPAQCSASDAELKERGEEACPPGSVIGTGSAVVKPILFPQLNYETVVFNADMQQVELLRANPPNPPAVVRAYFRGREAVSPIPTCLNGGYAPQDCPSDQVRLISNELSIPPFVNEAGRSYFTTPKRCPKSGSWRSPVILRFGDGVTESLVTKQPCERARTRVDVRPTTVKAGDRRRFGFLVEARLAGRWEPIKAQVRFAGERLRTNARGRVHLTTRFDEPGRRVAHVFRPGMRRSSDTVRVLPSG